MVLMAAFAALAESLGPEAILGAFAAGALLSVLDRDREMTHRHFREDVTLPKPSPAIMGGS